jgi:hypothetical protein
MLIHIIMTIEIFRPNENPFDQSYEDLIKNYWKFTCKISKNRNPSIDNDGQKDEIANQNSNAPVFYLNSSDKGDDLVERSCKVPAGKGIFIPFGVEISTGEKPNSSIDELKRIARKDQDSARNLSIKLDGIEVNNIDSYRKSTNEFRLEFPNNALFGCPQGTFDAVADGFYIITKPLSPESPHTVEIKGGVSHSEDIIDPQFSANIKYTLTVQ